MHPTSQFTCLAPRETAPGFDRAAIERLIADRRSPDPMHALGPWTREAADGMEAALGEIDRLHSCAEGRIAKHEADLARVTKQRDTAELALRDAVDQRTTLQAELERSLVQGDQLRMELFAAARAEVGAANARASAAELQLKRRREGTADEAVIEDLRAQVAAMRHEVAAAEAWTDDGELEDETMFNAVAAYRAARRGKESA